jgi:hypothetical protein
VAAGRPLRCSQRKLRDHSAQNRRVAQNTTVQQTVACVHSGFSDRCLEEARSARNVGLSHRPAVLCQGYPASNPTSEAWRASDLDGCCRKCRKSIPPSIPTGASRIRINNGQSGGGRSAENALSHTPSRGWRRHVGVEPTIRPAKGRIAGFEDRGDHRTPFASSASITVLVTQTREPNHAERRTRELWFVIRLG